MTSHFSIAGLQLALPCGNNIDVIEQEIRATKKRFPWVDMIVLSELCTFGPEKKYAEPLPSQTERKYAQIAEELDVWLIPGSLYEQAGDETFNTTSVINNQGEIIARYRKIYPFLPYEKGVSAGNEFIVFDVPQGRIGVAICYDLWFPEVARELASRGAEVLIYPTLTGTIDRSIEITMAKATAAFNQCYVVAVNGLGDYGLGQSVMAAPDGETIYQAGNTREIIPIEIDFEVVRRGREQGLKGLGQPLKSFRDNAISFPVYDTVSNERTAFDALGQMAVKGTNC